MGDVQSDHLARIEDELWWYEARRDLARMYLRKVSLPTGAAALDVGCGTGGSLALLSEYVSRVVGFDQSSYRIELARRKHPSIDLGLGDANALDEQFKAQTFDLVTCFNVLYHQGINDETSLLRQAWSVLVPGGFILVTEPAFNCLFRRQDRVSQAKRRYTLSEIRTLMERAGFEWVAGTYFNMVSFLPAWLLGLWDRLRPSRNRDAPLGELTMPPFPINEGMKLLMACERGAIRILGRMPVGVTLLGLARKPERIQADPTPDTPLASSARTRAELVHR